MSESALGVQEHASPEPVFRTYHLGQWVDHTASWLPAGAWEACPHMEPPGPGADVVLAVEGTYRRTAAVIGCSIDGAIFLVYAGEAASDDKLHHVLAESIDRWNVVEISHPKRLRRRLFEELANEGMPLRPWAGTPDEEASSAGDFHRAITEGRIPHNHHPVLSSHMDQLAVKTMNDGSPRLVRPADGADVDAALAARAAWWRSAEVADQVNAPPLRIY
jgi:hypothetical protein